MLKNLLLTACLLRLALMSGSAQALTPTFFTVQEIHFGTIQPVSGSCSMTRETAFVSAHNGQFICILSKEAKNGHYTITANPNKIVQIKFPPNLDDGNGVVFNPNVILKSDVENKVIYNNAAFQTIHSGTSGVINIYMGGEITVSTTYSMGQIITFSFPNAIEWNELP
jgi:hypothetical protein